MLVRQSQKGSALIYILIAIALLAALTATFMDSSSGQRTTAQETFNIVTQLNSQANFIRSAIQECVMTYPNGDSTLVGGVNVPYPLNADDPHLQDPTPPYFREAPATRCPGNPGNSNNHAWIFGASAGKPLPAQPAGFGPWVYENHDDGVYLIIGTNRTDEIYKTALTKLDDMFQECEADVINGYVGGQVISDDGDAYCDIGFLCFRLRLITLPNAVYPGDDDNDEASCP